MHRLYRTCLCLPLFLLPAMAHALPTHGQVSAGQATITSNGNATLIRQSSADSVINWGSFNIGANEKVQFIDPDASAITLNRITGPGASAIDGQLLSNGNVWLLNPDGVVLSKGSSANVAGLLATTSAISDRNFMSGDYSFTPGGNPGATVSNAGAITIAQGGLAALVAPNAVNSGTITATLGHVALASGDSYTLDMYGDGLINLATSPAVATQLVANHGSILANGGTVSLTTGAAGGVVDSLINMDGFIQADTVGGKAGSVTLKTSGTTDFSGTIDARGGATGGDGGDAEVSGDVLHFSGFVDLSAPKGKAGTLLLDPTDLYITSDGEAPEEGSSVISVAVLQDLLATNNVELNTGGNNKQDGNITLDSALSWSSGNELKLDAFRSIRIDAPVTISNSGGLNLITNDGGKNGTLSFSGGNVSFVNGEGTLNINGSAYTLANSFSALISDIQQNPSGYFALANNLDASGTTYAVSPGGVFSGTLEGLGHSISNLSVASTAAGTGENPANVGLFDTINGTVENLGLVNASVSSALNSAANVGTLAGINNGTIFNSYATGTATCNNGNGCGVGGLAGENISGAIIQSYANVTVGGQSSVAGGLVGGNGGSITQSYATGAVTGNFWAGGLAGDSLGPITQSYATGSVVNGGGFIGYNLSSISLSYATGSVTGTPGYIGGFAGNNDGTITHSYWDTETSGLSNAIGTEADSGSAKGITGLTTAQLQYGLPAGFSSTVWAINPIFNQGLPYLIALTYNPLSASNDTLNAGAVSRIALTTGSATGSGVGLRSGWEFAAGDVFASSAIAVGTVLTLSGDTPQPQYVIRGGRSAANVLIDTVRPLITYGLPNDYGVSAISEPDMSIAQLAEWIPTYRSTITYTTYGQLSVAGFAIELTGRKPTNPYHISILVPGGSPGIKENFTQAEADTLSALFQGPNRTHIIPNPYYTGSR